MAVMIALLTALDLEYAAVRAQASAWRPFEHPTGTRYEECGLPGGGTITIACTGMGNTRSAVITERTIALLRPRAVLFVGIAGGLRSGVKLGDVVVGTKVYAYHGGRVEDEGFRSRPDAWIAPHDLEQVARGVARAGTWWRSTGPDTPPTVHFRPIASGEVVLDARTSPLSELLDTSYGDAAAIEMESAGAAMAGLLNHSVPVLTIRGISDLADGRKAEAGRFGWRSVAATAAAAFAVALATEMASGSLPVAAEPATPIAGDDAVGRDDLSTSGTVKVEFCRRLGHNWAMLADVLGIRVDETAAFERGHEGRRIWEWLDNRRQLAALVPALIAIDRRDLADIIEPPG